MKHKGGSYNEVASLEAVEVNLPILSNDLEKYKQNNSFKANL